MSLFKKPWNCLHTDCPSLGAYSRMQDSELPSFQEARITEKAAADNKKPRGEVYWHNLNEPPFPLLIFSGGSYRRLPFLRVPIPRTRNSLTTPRDTTGESPMRKLRYGCSLKYRRRSFQDAPRGHGRRYQRSFSKVHCRRFCLLSLSQF